MKFVKGVVIGGLITTGFVMMYAETGKMNKKMIMKKKLYINCSGIRKLASYNTFL